MSLPSPEPYPRHEQSPIDESHREADLTQAKILAGLTGEILEPPDPSKFSVFRLWALEELGAITTSLSATLEAVKSAQDDGDTPPSIMDRAYYWRDLFAQTDLNVTTKDPEIREAVQESQKLIHTALEPEIPIPIQADLTRALTALSASWTDSTIHDALHINFMRGGKRGADLCAQLLESKDTFVLSIIKELQENHHPPAELLNFYAWIITPLAERLRLAGNLNEASRELHLIQHIVSTFTPGSALHTKSYLNRQWLANTVAPRIFDHTASLPTQDANQGITKPVVMQTIAILYDLYANPSERIPPPPPHPLLKDFLMTLHARTIKGNEHSLARRGTHSPKKEFNALAKLCGLDELHLTVLDR